MGIGRRFLSPPALDLEASQHRSTEALTSPDSVEFPPFSYSRRTGTGSTAETSSSTTAANPFPTRTRTHGNNGGQKPPNGWIKSSPTVNVHTTCGRHTDQLLFGGPSLTGLAKAFLPKRKKRTGGRQL